VDEEQMALRERPTREDQKAQRRLALVEAAESLIRETGSTEFSMLVLAERAGLSPTTPYNLFGTKAAILYALLDRSADNAFADASAKSRGSDPYRRVLRASDALAGVLRSDPDFFKPLYAYLIGVVDTVYRPAFMARARVYWEDALAGVASGRRLPPGTQAPQLAQQLAIHALGGLEMWIQQELDDQQLVAQMRLGTCLLLLGIAPPEARTMLRDEMAAAVQQLPETPASQP
jgi:AcrR family transcriptional regulator